MKLWIKLQNIMKEHESQFNENVLKLVYGDGCSTSLQKLLNCIFDMGEFYSM